MNHIEFGKLGEDAAVALLKRKHYKILERNFKTEIGEIDIIAEKKKTVVFVEVKTRKSDDFGRPSMAVNQSKQRKIEIVAVSYLKKNCLLETACRFDVIEVAGNEVKHIENAFISSKNYY